METQIDISDNPDSDIIENLSLAKLISGLGIGYFMSSFDATVGVILLPKISESYANASPNQIQWVVLAYLLTMIGLTVIAGDLGDKYSNKMMFQLGMVIFTLGSLFCFLSYYSKHLILLVVSRIIQAVGASCIMANGVAIVTRFTTTGEGGNRGKAMGFNNLIISVSVVLGPVLGTFFLRFWNWGGVFFINVPLGIIGFIWCFLAIPETKPLEKVKKADYLGSILLTATLTLFMLSLSLFVEDIIPNSVIFGIVCLGLSIIIAPLFILREKTAIHPLVDLPMMKNKKISFALITAILKHQGYIVILYHFNLYLQNIIFNVDDEFGILKVGLVISGLPVGMAIFAAISGKFSDTIDARFLCTVAMVIVVLTLTMLAIFLDTDLPIWIYVVVAAIVGISIGLFQSPNVNSLMTASPKEKLGVAAGLHGLTTSVGISLGTAISTAIFTFVSSRYAQINGLDQYSPTNYVLALRWMFLAFAIITAFGAILSYFRGPEMRDRDHPVKHEHDPSLLRTD